MFWCKNCGKTRGNTRGNTRGKNKNKMTLLSSIGSLWLRQKRAKKASDETLKSLKKKCSFLLRNSFYYFEYNRYSHWQSNFHHITAHYQKWHQFMFNQNHKAMEIKTKPRTVWKLVKYCWNINQTISRCVSCWRWCQYHYYDLALISLWTWHNPKHWQQTPLMIVSSRKSGWN